MFTAKSTLCSPAAMRAAWQSAQSAESGLLISVALGVAELWQLEQLWSAPRMLVLINRQDNKAGSVSSILFMANIS